jgi:hypothetical protein
MDVPDRRCQHEQVTAALNASQGILKDCQRIKGMLKHVEDADSGEFPESPLLVKFFFAQSEVEYDIHSI